MLGRACAGALHGFGYPLSGWSHPAAIFTGTSGVMFLGYTLALLSIMGTAKVAVAVRIADFKPTRSANCR